MRQRDEFVCIDRTEEPPRAIHLLSPPVTSNCPHLVYDLGMRDDILNCQGHCTEMGWGWGPGTCNSVFPSDSDNSFLGMLLFSWWVKPSRIQMLPSASGSISRDSKDSCGCPPTLGLSLVLSRRSLATLDLNCSFLKMDKKTMLM